MLLRFGVLFSILLVEKIRRAEKRIRVSLRYQNDCTHTVRFLRSWKFTDISVIVFRLPLGLIFDVKGNGRGGKDRYRFNVALYRHSFTAVSLAGPRKINQISINQARLLIFYFHEYFSSILSLYKQGREKSKIKNKRSRSHKEKILNVPSLKLESKWTLPWVYREYIDKK